VWRLLCGHSGYSTIGIEIARTPDLDEIRNIRRSNVMKFCASAGGVEEWIR
jgi:hypothetical protein